jgi:hypothetical protein
MRRAAGRDGVTVARLDMAAATARTRVGEDAGGNRRSPESLQAALAAIDARARAIVRYAERTDPLTAMDAMFIVDRVSDLRRLIGGAA